MNNSVLIKCLASIFTFIILFTGCSKEYSIETGASLAATGSLQDANGNCMTDTTIGTFYDGVIPNGNLTAANDTAYVLVKVNVTTAGSYNITSDTQNGIYFSDSGYFTSTGIDTIRLKPVGTPILPISSVYSISFDSSTCNFTVVAKDSTGLGLGGGGTTGGGTPSANAGTWQFTTPDGTFFGSAAADISTTLGTALEIKGLTVGRDSTLLMGIPLQSAVVPTSGTFSNNTGCYFSLTAFNIIYEISAGSYVGSVFPTLTINITSYNSSSKELVGNFSGSVVGSSGIVPLTNGQFDVIVQ